MSKLLQACGGRMAALIGRESWLTRRLRPGYEVLLDVTALGRGIPWSINGVPCRISPYHRPHMARNYDAPVAAFFRERVRPGDCCFDVGANVGVYVIQFAHWSGPAGRVVAFEPNPAAQTVLDRHIRYNRLADRTRVVPKAVGAEDKAVCFHAAGADGRSRVGVPNPALTGKTATLEVPVITLDGFCRAEGESPDWLLIDIEGFELEALRGAVGLLRDATRRPRVVAEFHPNAWPAAGYARPDVEAFLAEHRLRPVPLTGQADPLIDHGTVYLEAT